MAAVGLKTSIWNNNIRSFILLGLYPLILAGMVWLVAFISGYAILEGASGPAGYAGHYYSAVSADIGAPAAQQATAFVAAWWPAILSAAAVWFAIAFFFNTRMVRMLSHSRPVIRTEEPELYNLLENLCISRGLPMPKLEIIETDARNAFASGINKNSYTITVTRGLLHSLKKDELEAVLGHELTHIMNNDVRLLIISVIFTGMIGFICQVFWSNFRHSLFMRSHRGGGRRNQGGLIFVMLAIGIVLWLGYIATIFTRFALSRRREFMADAGAVELTHNPEAMMRALLRISGADRIPDTTEDIAMMCIENGHRFMGLFATHPPLADRIRAIAEATQTPVPEIEPGSSALKKNPWA